MNYIWIICRRSVQSGGAVGRCSRWVLSNGAGGGCSWWVLAVGAVGGCWRSVLLGTRTLTTDITVIKGGLLNFSRSDSYLCFIKDSVLTVCFHTGWTLVTVDLKSRNKNKSNINVKIQEHYYKYCRVFIVS